MQFTRNIGKTQFRGIHTQQLRVRTRSRPRCPELQTYKGRARSPTRRTPENAEDIAGISFRTKRFHAENWAKLGGRTAPAQLGRVHKM